MTDESRARILQRRARFMTAALASIAGCTPSGSNAPGAAIKPDPSTAPKSSEVATSTANPDAMPADLPALDVPAGVNDTARGAYEALAKEVPSIHKELAAAEKTLPKCTIAATECRELYRAIADHLTEARRIVRHLGPRCEGSSKDAHGVANRVEAHRKYAQARIEKLEKAIDGALGPQGTKATDAWHDVLIESQNARPEPCLKYGCADW